MRNILAVLSCLALSAAPLSIGLPVHAQQPGGSPSIESPTHEARGGAWNGECPERQELREERQRIRADHEELKSEHDRLKAQCMDAKGQDRSECVAKKTALHAKIDALHERMKVLQEKAEADPGCHREHKGKEAKGSWPSHQGQSSIGSSTTPTSGTGK